MTPETSSPTLAQDSLVSRGETPFHTYPRLYIDQSFVTETPLTPSPEQTRYLLSVMRAKDGDSIRVFNGIDGDWLVILHQTGKKGCHLHLDSQIRSQTHEPDLWLCPAPIKRSHFDDIIMKSTELGVARICPILTARTQIRDINPTRARAIAIEAAEQSERLSIPEIMPLQTLKQLLTHWPSDRPLLYCAEHGQAQLIGPYIQGLERKKQPSCAILTGPEGGLTTDELTLLRTNPNAQAVRLGPRILRADTAALAALSCWQALQGDWT